MFIEITSNGDFAKQSIETKDLGIFDKLPYELLQKITDELEVSHRVDICWDAMKNIMSRECYNEFKIEHTDFIRCILFEHTALIRGISSENSEQENYDDY